MSISRESLLYLLGEKVHLETEQGKKHMGKLAFDEKDHDHIYLYDVIDGRQRGYAPDLSPMPIEQIRTITKVQNFKLI